MSDSLLPFTTLAPGVGIGEAPAGWITVTACPLLILVGVTGVGKSTTLAALPAIGLRHRLLPDRRRLTDDLIIATMQAQAGVPVSPVTDRKERFAYTRAYRERHPGGMAHALAQLWIDPATLPGHLVFDGLRGADEVAYAAALPAARFAVLEAPDAVRVARLMGRNDPFDRIDAHPATPDRGAGPHDFVELGLPGAQRIFSPAEEQALLAMMRRGDVTAGDLRRSLAIVVEERRNYDPAAASATLCRLAPDRTLVIDTAQHAPAAVAAAIRSLVASLVTSGG